MYEIRLLGKFQVRRDSEVLDGVFVGKVHELFCYLLLHRDLPLRREDLGSILWRDLPETTGRKYLRHILWRLQRILSPPEPGAGDERLVQAEVEWVRLNSGPNLRLDVALLEETFGRVEALPVRDWDGATLRAVRDVIDLYHGGLLGAWNYEWCQYRRERLEAMYLALLERLVLYSLYRHDTPLGLLYGAKILDVDPAHELTHRRLMRLRYFSGDRTGALRQYEECRRALREQLDVDPSRRTTVLYEQIQSDKVPEIKDAQ